MSYLKNCWYMAAWADEVTEGACLARTLLDERVVLFRSVGGAVAALNDRCPHRFAPLSKGQVSEGSIVCPYHGLAFDGRGQCSLNPHGQITRSMAVRSYPLVEAYKALWIWMGQPERADPSLLTDLTFLEKAPPTAFSKGYVLGRGNYQLFTDNILDLSHVDFLHPNTLGGGAITRTRAQVSEDQGAIAIKWHSFNEAPAPLIKPRLPQGVETVDSWTEVTWTAPAIMRLVNGAVPAGLPREGAGNAFNVHIMTPETMTSTHYFYASTRDFNVDDVVANENIRRIRNEIFGTEDEPMIRAQQDNIGGNEFWSLKPVILGIDAGAVRVRRRLDKLIAEEQGLASASPRT